MDKKYNNLKNVIIVFLIFLVITIIVKFIKQPLIFFIIVAYAANPIKKKLNRVLKISQSISSLLALVIINILIVFLLCFFGNITFQRVYFFMENQYNDLLIYIVSILKKINVQNNITMEILKENISEFIYSLINNREVITKGALYTTQGFVSFLIGNITAYFVLTDGKSIKKYFSVIITENVMNFIEERARDIDKMFKISILIVGLTTLVTICGFYILHIPNALMLGIICGVLDIIPIVGTIVVFMPLILYNIYVKNYIIAFGVTALYIMVLIYSQVINAKFLGNRLNIHPLAVIIAIYIGTKIYGMAGMVMSLLYVCTINELIVRNEKVRV